MHAYDLIDSPEKWYAGRPKAHGQSCASDAIFMAYKGRDANEARQRLRARITNPFAPEHEVSIIAWNDGNDWKTVFRTLVELGI
jgi:hypothetical protein